MVLEHREFEIKEPVEQWFSTWESRAPEGSRVDVLCTQLYCLCFIRVLAGGRWVIASC